MLLGLGFGLQITLCSCGRHWEGVSPNCGPFRDFKPLQWAPEHPHGMRGASTGAGPF